MPLAWQNGHPQGAARSEGVRTGRTQSCCRNSRPSCGSLSCDGSALASPPRVLSLTEALPLQPWRQTAVLLAQRGPALLSGKGPRAVTCNCTTATADATSHVAWASWLVECLASPARWHSPDASAGGPLSKGRALEGSPEEAAMRVHHRPTLIDHWAQETQPPSWCSAFPRSPVVSAARGGACPCTIGSSATSRASGLVLRAGVIFP